MSDFWDDPVHVVEDDSRGFGPVFAATHETDSACCEDLILPGEDARADGRGGWIHADDSCEAIAAGTDLETSRTPVAVMSPVPCSRCTASHPGEC